MGTKVISLPVFRLVLYIGLQQGAIVENTSVQVRLHRLSRLAAVFYFKWELISAPTLPSSATNQHRGQCVLSLLFRMV
jgi:hypothetical protein